MRGLDRPLPLFDARFRLARAFDVEYRSPMIILPKGWLRLGLWSGCRPDQKPRV